VKIYTPTSDDQRAVVAEAIEDIEYFVVGNLSGKFLELDYWLGSSHDGSTWALYETTTQYLEDDNFALTSEHLICWLTNPPKRNREVIGTILFQVRVALPEVGTLAGDKLHTIVESNPFPEYGCVADLLPDAPKHWLDLPVEIELSLPMSEGACVYRALFSEYERSSLDEVIKTVFEPRIPSILLHYSLKTRGTTTPYTL
jgi:hypothetical protein